MIFGREIGLREVRLEDVELLYRWVNDPEFMGDYLPFHRVPKESLQKRIEKSQEDAQHQIYLITELASGAPMGTALFFYPFNLYQSALFKGWEIAYQVHPRFRGRGVATEAARLLVRHLFQTTSAGRIQGTVIEGNRASCRVLEKVGMKKEGICRKMALFGDQYVDMNLYSIIREEWTPELKKCCEDGISSDRETRGRPVRFSEAMR